MRAGYGLPSYLHKYARCGLKIPGNEARHDEPGINGASIGPSLITPLASA